MRPGSLLATSEKTDPNSLPSLGVPYVLFSAFPTEQSLSARAGADKLPIVATLVATSKVHISYSCSSGCFSLKTSIKIILCGKRKKKA